MSVKAPLVALGMPRTVKQPLGSGLCLAACAATILGENKSAFNAWSLSGYIRKMSPKWAPHLTDRRYMDMADVTIILALQGIRLGSWWSSGEDMECTFDAVTRYSIDHQINEAPALVIVRTDSPDPTITHAVVYDNEAQGVRDPSNAVTDEISPLENYWIAEWYPIDRFPTEGEILQ